MGKKLKISFDFDDCLTRRSVRKVAKSLIMKGDDVWIVTSRSGDLSSNADVREVAKKLGIPNEKCIFVGDWKINYFQNEKDFDYHVDDYWFEITEINSKLKSPVAIPCDLGLFFKEIEEK